MSDRGTAGGYQPRDGGGLEISETNLDWVGDGGVYTSVNDYFCGVDSSPRRPWGATWRRLRARLVNAIGPDDAGGGCAFGLSLSTTAGGERVIDHGGAWVAFRTSHRRYPDRGLGVFAFCNRPDSGLEARMDRIESLLLPAPGES